MTDTDTDTDTDKKEPSDVPSEASVSEDARQLTRTFALAIKSNGHPVPAAATKAHQSWLVEMDRLLSIGPPSWDGDPPAKDEVARVIEWCVEDDFERANVRAVPKFRKRYSQLRLKALNSTPRASGPAVNVSEFADGTQRF